MTATLTWGSSMPLPEYDGIGLEDVPIVASRRMLSGYLRTDILATKAKMTIRWGGLTLTERNALKSQWDSGTEASITLPDGQSYTVVAVTESWSEEQKYDAGGAPYYTVTIVFEEV